MVELLEVVRWACWCKKGVPINDAALDALCTASPT
jgi:hypothetical protein